MIKLGSNSIGKIYLGSNPIGKAYLGSNLVFQKGSGPSPQPTSISYIRGGADGSYIDTGIIPDSTTKVIIWARNFNVNGDFLFGSKDSSGNARFAILAPGDKQNADRIRFDFGSSYSSYVDNASNGIFGGYHKFEVDGNKFYVDDALKATQTAATFEGTHSLHLFGQNNAGTHSAAGKMIDICACKIYKNNILVRDFKAVNTPSIGLYDSVSNTLFTNVGSGTFTFGSFDKDAYTPLEYIIDSGNACFDSGVKGGYAIPVFAKFRYTTNTVNVALLGYRTSSEYCEFNINYGSTIGMWYRLGDSNTINYLYNSNSSNFLDHDISLAKGDTNTAELYENHTKKGDTASPSSSSSYISTGNLYVCALDDKGTIVRHFTGRLYYMSIGTSRNFVPAKIGNNVGMYDTYNDVLYTSETESSFEAGPVISN